MREAGLLLKILVVLELYDFDLSESLGTSLLMSGRKEPMPSRKGWLGLLEKPMEKMFQGAV